jgi:hypothetical protein
VRPAHLFRDDVAGQVAIVRALHHDHKDAGFRIVEAPWQYLVPDAQRLEPDGFGFDAFDVVRVVADDDVAAFACRQTTERGRETVPDVHIVEAGLGVLVVPKAEALGPAVLIPLALDELTTPHAVA